VSGPLYRLLNGADEDVLGGPVGPDNVYMRSYGRSVVGQPTIDALEVGQHTLRQYALSGSRPTVYRIVRVA